MKGFFRKLFHIYPGEEANAFLFASLGFLWALGVTLGQKFADALFLLHVGAEFLPVAYMVAACILVVLATFLLKAFHLISIHRLFIAILSAGAIFYLFAHTSLLFNWGVETQWIWYALKVAGTVLFALMVTCFWNFIDQYYQMQDAKRLFSLFTSAIFLGIATTGAIMRSGLLAFEQLTLIIVALLLSAAVAIHYIVRRAKPVYDEAVLESSGDEGDQTFRFLLHSILTSRFTLFLMIGNFLMFVLMVITEYSYLSSFDEYFDPGIVVPAGGEETASLTLFLGQCLAAVSIINLFVGLFVYSRSVRRFGVNNLLLLTPLFLLLTFSGWNMSTTLLFPIFGFFVVEGMLYIVEDNNFTLLLNAVPTKMKYKIRLVAESFFEPFGMLVSALMITFLPIDSIKLGLILSGCACGIALFLRKQYLKGIYINLSDNAVHFQRSLSDWFTSMSNKQQNATEHRLLAMLRLSENEQEQLLTLEALLSFGNEKNLSKLLQQAETLSPSAKVTFLQMLAKSRFSNTQPVMKMLERWPYEESSELKGHIQFYLALNGTLPHREALANLTSPDLLLRGAAIIALRSGQCEGDRALANHQLQLLLESGEENKQCMALQILGFKATLSEIETLLPFLQDRSIKVARSSAAAIAQLTNRQAARHAPQLISCLEKASDSELRQSCLQALGRMDNPELAKEMISSSVHFRPAERRLTEALIMQMGPDVVPHLLAVAQDNTQYDRCRVLACRILGRLALPQLRAHLYDIVYPEIERAYFYFYHLQTIQAQYPDIDLSLLEDDLRSSFYSVLDFVIQLLGVAGESEDCELLSHCLRSPNPKVRSQVVETLEKACDRKIFRLLYPLITDIPQEEKLNAYLRAGGTPLTLEALLDHMSHSPIQGDQLVASALKYRLNLPNWRESLHQQLSSRDTLVHHFAHELLET